MQALVITRFGEPDVLEIRELPVPEVKPGQELVHAQAGGINFADLMTMKGGYSGTPEPPLIAGREFAGLRASDGALVMGYTQWGAFAEQVSARPDLLWPAPHGWTVQEAAAFPVNYFTALLAYWRAGLVDFEPAAGLPSVTIQRSRPPRVLIQAVAGGVGTAALQIGKLLGMEMWGTSSSHEKLARAKTLGLQHAINYREVDYEDAIREQTRREGVDAVFEMLGGEHVSKAVRCLSEFGAVVVYGSASGQTPQLDTRLLYARATSVNGLWLSQLSNHRPLMQQAWKKLAAWTSAGHLHPVIGSILPLSQAPEAYRAMISRQSHGKIVLTIP